MKNPRRHQSRRDHPSRGVRRAFSLIEALIASVVLAVIVLAVGSGVSAGRQHSLEAEKLILATIAADDMLSELSTVPYDNLATYDGLLQGAGAMATLDGAAYPPGFWLIGRSVDVEPLLIIEPKTGVVVRGRRLTVAAFDELRVLASVETFVAEPGD